MTHRERMLMVDQGEMPDVIPYVPRIDLWYLANSFADTLPANHRGRTQDEIARAEGWALHKLTRDYVNVREPEHILHFAIGVISLKEILYI